MANTDYENIPEEELWGKYKKTSDPKIREYFILKYNLSLSEIKYIDEVFKFCVVNDIRDFPSFKNEIQKKIPRFTSDNIFELLLEAYEFHQPISRKILDSTQ